MSKEKAQEEMNKGKMVELWLDTPRRVPLTSSIYEYNVFHDPGWIADEFLLKNMESNIEKRSVQVKEVHYCKQKILQKGYVAIGEEDTVLFNVLKTISESQGILSKKNSKLKHNNYMISTKLEKEQDLRIKAEQKLYDLNQKWYVRFFSLKWFKRRFKKC